MNLSLHRVLAVALALRNVEGQSCNQALTEAVACQERAMATHESELIEPTVELGRKWLELEARRNCRFITTLNACGDELVAVCPSMFEFWTNMGLDILNEFQKTNEDWDTEKCPGAMALRGKEGKLEPGSEVDESAEEDDDGDEDEEAMGNSSSQMKQTSLYGLVLMAGQLIALFA